MQENDLIRRQNLTKWLERLKDRVLANKVAHYESSGKHQFWHYFLRITSIILSLAVGASLFSTLEKRFGEVIKIWLGIFSIVSAALSFIQIFLRSSEISAIHKTFAARFGKIERKIELLLADQPKDLVDYKKNIEKINEEVDSLASDAPLVKTDEPAFVVVSPTK